MSTSAMQKTILRAPSGISTNYKPWDKHARGRMAAVWRMQTALDVAIRKQRLDKEEKRRKEDEKRSQNVAVAAASAASVAASVAAASVPVAASVVADAPSTTHAHKRSSSETRDDVERSKRQK